MYKDTKTMSKKEFYIFSAAWKDIDLTRVNILTKQKTKYSISTIIIGQLGVICWKITNIGK